MIGVAGTVFSVTLVALTLASSQFGSRLIQNFMYVRLNQIVLGSYVGTYLYSLLVLNTIRDTDNYVFIPSFSTILAILVDIVNIILMIVFIHRIATSIQADKIISNISESILKQIHSLFPEKIGDEPKEEKNFDEEAAISSYTNKISIKSPKGGYVRYINNKILFQIVSSNDSLFQLTQRTGNFLVKDEEIGVLYTNKDWDEASIDKLLSHIVIGPTKTMQQDLEFSIHQIVEIASKALSPGVNDPYTAITCIDNLTYSMCYLAQVKFPQKYLLDEDGNLRVIANVIDFQGVLNSAFNQIRQFS